MLHKDRRHSPQYLLLDGNVPLSLSAKHFPAILEVLTSQLWGLSVSLQDFADTVMAHLEHDLLKKRSLAPNHDYKET